MIPRLKAGLFVRALIRRAEVAGASAYVVRHGAEEGGAIILRLSPPGAAATVLTQARRGEGELVWVKPIGDAPDAEKIAGWCEKQIRIDPDIWIVDIEDREGRAFVDEPVV
ncbi:MAG TPA: DUF1491 family protein [Rhizomicrobium sp.]|nr:DUF1491 family protein [Rhizomicrobium sp.]